MANLGKVASLIVIAVLAVSGLVVLAAPAFAAVPKPSVPEFTVKFVNASYNVTTTNSYTGLNETRQVSNNSIEVTISNQPFDYSNNQLYYNIRTKPHFAENWTEIYPLQNRTSSYDGDGTFSFAEYLSPDSPAQSNSSTTTIAFPVVATDLYQASGYDIQRYYSGGKGQAGEYSAFLMAIPGGGELDFQVDAVVGHNSQDWYIQHPFTPTYGGFFEPAVAYDVDSGWSSTQTVTIGENAGALTPTESASPSHSPTATPAQPQAGFLFGLDWEPTAVVVLVVVVACLAVGLVVLWRRVAAKPEPFSTMEKN
jgi:hypothetical protein